MTVNCKSRNKSLVETEEGVESMITDISFEKKPSKTKLRRTFIVKVLVLSYLITLMLQNNHFPLVFVGFQFSRTIANVDCSLCQALLYVHFSLF